MRRTLRQRGSVMRTRILSILAGALLAAIPFTVSQAAPVETEGSKTICVSGSFSALCDHRNNNNSQSEASSEDDGGEHGCGYGGEGGYGSYGSKKGYGSFGKKGFGGFGEKGF